MISLAFFSHDRVVNGLGVAAVVEVVHELFIERIDIAG